MVLAKTLDHIQQARTIANEGARDLIAQRNLVECMEANGGVEHKDMLLLKQLEEMQRKCSKQLHKLESELSEELRLTEAEDVQP